MLMSIASIGNKVGVPTSHSDLVGDVACLVNGTLENVGLAKLEEEQLLKYFDEGEAPS